MSNPAEASPAEAPAPRARARRPELERDHPIRHFSCVFREAEPQRAEAQAPGGDAVSRAVELGYRVIDEYIRQGQRAAQRLNDRSLGPETIARDVQDLTARMSQYASDFLGVWFEVLELATAGRLARPGTQDGQTVPTPPPAPTPPRAERPPAGERTRVRVDVSSARPAEVSLDLVPDAARRSLVVHALRAVDPDKPRLTDVALEPGAHGEPLTLRIRVPADQPPGVYSGLLIDEQTNRPAGTISVRLGPG